MRITARFSRVLPLVMIGAAILAGPAAALAPRHMGGRVAVVTAASDAALDAYLRSQLDELGLPGLSAAVVRGGVIEHLVAMGEADDTGRPMTGQTPVHLASISKGFTALAIMQLVQAGKIRLDDPVVTYLPWFRLADEAASQKITVAQCLHHTSGIPVGDFDLQLNFKAVNIAGSTPVEQGVRSLATVALRDRPGASFEYTNLGYNVLGAIVEAVSGQTYADYVATHIFGPLRMTHTHSTIETARKDGLAEGFSTIFGVYRQRSVPTPEASEPSATSFSSAEDLAHEIEMYLAGGNYYGTELISPATEKALHAPAVIVDDATYTMGWWRHPQWELSTDPGDPTADAAVPTIVEHDGDWPNTKTYIGYVPATREGLVLLVNANSQSQGSKVWALHANAWRVLHGIPLESFVPQEEFLQRFGWQIAAAIVLLELLVAVTTSWTLRRRPAPLPRKSGAARILWLGLPLLLDASVLVLGLVLVPDNFDTTFPGLVTDSSPDVGWLVFAAVVVAAVSAATRLVVLIRMGVTDWRNRSRAGPARRLDAG